MNVSWQTSSQSDISKCSVIPSSIRYQEEGEEDASTNDNANDSPPIQTKMNRMAIANQDFEAGDVVLCNAPLACSLLSLDDSTSSKHCAFCFVTEQKLSRCARCQSIWYCSRDCQKQDFGLHKKECLYWKKKQKTKPSNQASSLISQQNGRIKAEISLLIRTHAKIELLQAKEDKDEEVFPQTTSPQTVIHSRIQHLASLAQYPFSLDPSEESIIQEATSAILWFQEEQEQAKKNQKKVESTCKTPLTRQEIQQQMQDLLRIFRVNNFGITDELLKVVASAVYPLGALLNHSCQPNCILRYHYYNCDDTNKKAPPVLEIVACRPITKGEELTHSYVELVQPRSVRQERLKSNYGFDCHCQRCTISSQTTSTTTTTNKDWMQLQDSIQVGIFLDYYNPCYPSHQKWSTTTALRNNDVVNHDGRQDWNELRQMATHLQAKAKQCMAMDNLEGEILLLKQCVGVLSQLLQEAPLMENNANDESSFSTIHETCLELYQVRGDLLGSLLLAGQTEQAIIECEYVVAFLVSILVCDQESTNCPNHPILGLQLFTLGDLYSTVGWEDKAQRTFAWTKNIMMVSHGSNSNMVKLLQDR